MRPLPGLGLALTIGMLVAMPTSLAQAKPDADYRFEGNFKSAVSGVKRLAPEGPARTCPPCAYMTKTKVKGKRQGVWAWPEGDGLRLGRANDVTGRKGKTYTFVFLVKLDTVSSYRKLVDFEDLNEDEGWYVYEESLYPYDLDDFNYSKERIQAGKWRQIVLTRDRTGLVRGYVDGEKIGKAKDAAKDQTLGAAKKLHFLIDDGGSEHSGGMIARLRIWDHALHPKAVKRLGS